MHAGGQHEALAPPFAYAVKERADVSHEFGEQGSVLLDFGLPEERPHVVVDLDTVGAVAVADLLDDGETFLPDLGMAKFRHVDLPGSAESFADHVFGVLLLEAGEHIAVASSDPRPCRPR